MPALRYMPAGRSHLLRHYALELVWCARGRLALVSRHPRLERWLKPAYLHPISDPRFTPCPRARNLGVGLVIHPPQAHPTSIVAVTPKVAVIPKSCCHPERKGPQTYFSLGVVSRRICFCFRRNPSNNKAFQGGTIQTARSILQPRRLPKPLHRAPLQVSEILLQVRLAIPPCAKRLVSLLPQLVAQRR